MKLTHYLAVTGLALTMGTASHAADFDFSKAFGGYHKYLEFTEDDVDLRVDPVNGSKVSWTYQGLGRGTWGFNYLMGKREALTFSFGQATDVGSIILESYGWAKIKWTYEDGSTGSLDYANAELGGYETFLGLEGITSLTVKAKRNYVIVNGFRDVFATSEVPVPAAAWLFGSALLGLGGLKRRQH